MGLYIRRGLGYDGHHSSSKGPWNARVGTDRCRSRWLDPSTLGRIHLRCYSINMKLWLDDVRFPPPLWGDYLWVKTAPAAIEALETMEFDEVSLDHDLGSDLKAGDGYDVLLWIEYQVRVEGWKPPRLRIHTSNPAARE